MTKKKTAATVSRAPLVKESAMHEDGAPLAPVDKDKKLIRSAVIAAKSFDPESYKYNPSFQDWDGEDYRGVHTTPELIRALESDPKVELDARVLCLRKDENKIVTGKVRKLTRSQFVEGFKADAGSKIKIRENFNGDFGSGFIDSGSLPVGRDFTPLIGGPFYKNLYYYIDYIRMHSDAFFAYHNDPFARAIIQITRDFVLGTGYEVQCDTKTDQGKFAMAAWKAFEEANDLQLQIDQTCEELGIYGETMFWKLPGQRTKLTYRLSGRDTIPIGMIPRVRLIDPSNIVEIVTYPEDITRPLFYVWLQPTQWQIFTTAQNPEIDAPPQPTAKFIYQQIPASEMLHFKINAVSNEKRGRSDFFPIFNYLKRLRDSVQYAMIALEKVSAWSIDTTIEGDQTDINNYISEQQRMGTIPPPGSEFIHSAAIKRNYLGIQHATNHSSDVFQWCLSCIAAGSGIPISYFGTHLSGGTTRASALVATEPVAKKMEKRREVMKRVIRKLWQYCMQEAGLPNIDCNIIFPEMITQDVTDKLNNLLFAEQARWIKPERAATMAAKELGIQNYSYVKEMSEMPAQLKQIPMPLVDPSKLTPPESMDPADNDSAAPSGDGGNRTPLAGGLSSADKAQVKNNDRTL